MVNERDTVKLTCCGEGFQISHAALKRAAWAASHKLEEALDEPIPFRPQDAETRRGTLERLQDHVTNYRIKTEALEAIERLIDWLDGLPPF